MSRGGCPRRLSRSAQSTAENALKEGIKLNQRLLAEVVPVTVRIADIIVDRFQAGGRLFFLGNGGSAAQAQHCAAEFVVRFKRQRRPLPAIALTSDTSVLTAMANDFGFEQVFARQVEALVEPEDVLVALSTSGASANVLEAVEAARQRGAFTIGFTGDRKGPLARLVDIPVEVPSGDTMRIQEAHLLLWHIICDLVDAAVAGDQDGTGNG